MEPQYRFEQRVDASSFTQALERKVDLYFRERGISKYGNVHFFIKIMVGFALWFATLMWLLSDSLTAFGVIGVYVLHGYAQLYLGLNIAHDANHKAISPSHWINRVLGYTFDLVGLSSYMWRLMHNDSHHYFVNIRNADSALGYGNIFRISPHDKREPFHRYQHLYAPFLYCLATLDWVFAKDYRCLRYPRFGNHKIKRHASKDLAFLFASKAFYYTYTLVLPLSMLSVPWYVVIAGFLIMHFFLGFTLALTFQPNHFTEASSFPEPDKDGHIDNHYIRHVFENTSDYARGNPLACWFLGGLNLHAVHHMFPSVCHVHYPALTEILKSTAEEHGYAYPENVNVLRAFFVHLKWLKLLGSVDGVPDAKDWPGRPDRTGMTTAGV